jgi:hypothetical protein
MDTLQRQTVRRTAERKLQAPRRFFLTTDRAPVHAGDPPEVFELVAKLLADYRDKIVPVVDDIIQEFSDPDRQTSAATAYIARIGSEIPDATIRAAVKKLASSKFRQRGIDVPTAVAN